MFRILTPSGEIYPAEAQTPMNQQFCPNTSSSYSGASFSAYGSPPRLNDRSIKLDFCLL